METTLLDHAVLTKKKVNQCENVFLGRRFSREVDFLCVLFSTKLNTFVNIQLIGTSLEFLNLNI